MLPKQRPRLEHGFTSGNSRCRAVNAFSWVGYGPSQSPETSLQDRKVCQEEPKRKIVALSPCGSPTTSYRMIMAAAVTAEERERSRRRSVNCGIVPTSIPRSAFGGGHIGGLAGC